MTKDGYTYLLAQYASQFLPNVMANHPDWDFDAQIREARDMAARFIKGIYGSVAEVK